MAGPHEAFEAAQGWPSLSGSRAPADIVFVELSH